MTESVANEQSKTIGQWVAENRNRLLLFAMQRTRNKNRNDAEELVQEAITRTLEARIPNEVLADSAKLSGWIFRTTRNLILDRQKKKSSSESYVSDQADAFVAASESTPEEYQIRAEEWELFRECEKLLSADERLVLWKRLNGLSHDQIVEEMNWEKTNQSEKALSKGKKKLVDCMEAKRS